MNTGSEQLVYWALGSVVAIMVLGAYVILKTPDDADSETRKLRFAAATFAGITMLFVFISVLYFAGNDPKENPGKQIFEKGFTALFTLAGTILGYLFGSKNVTTTVSAGRTHEHEGAAPIQGTVRVPAE